MTEKRQKNIKITWIVIIVMAIVAASMVLIVLINKNHKTEVDTPTAAPASGPLSSASASELSEVAVTVNYYDSYKLDDVDFGFVLANIHIATTKTVSVPLSQFETDEGIKLSDTAKYSDALNAASYSLDSKNIVTALSAKGSGFDAEILIPFEDKTKTELNVVCAFNEKNNFSLDLSRADTTADSLKVKPTADSQAQRTLSVQVDNGVELDPSLVLTTNDESYFMPSTARIFAFPVTVTAPNNGTVTIQKASFVTANYGTMTAEAADVHTKHYANILGQTISDSGTGYVFIMVLDPGRAITAMSGQMKLEMSDSSQNTTQNVSIK